MFTADAGKVDVEVNYAVYAPNQFDASAVAAAVGQSVDPSNGDRYVYAYQLWNVGGTQTISGLSVGLAELGNPGRCLSTARSLQLRLSQRRNRRAKNPMM